MYCYKLIKTKIAIVPLLAARFILTEIECDAVLTISDDTNMDIIASQDTI
jgi:hypothetical protein